MKKENFFLKQNISQKKNKNTENKNHFTFLF